MGLASAQQAYLRTRRNPLGQISPEDMTVPPLPEGWEEELDEATGVHYYVHDESGKRSWVRPNFRPPGPGGPMMGGKFLLILFSSSRRDGFAWCVLIGCLIELNHRASSLEF